MHNISHVLNFLQIIKISLNKLRNTILILRNRIIIEKIENRLNFRFYLQLSWKGTPRSVRLLLKKIKIDIFTAQINCRKRVMYTRYRLPRFSFRSLLEIEVAIKSLRLLEMQKAGDVMYAPKFDEDGRSSSRFPIG